MTLKEFISQGDKFAAHAGARLVTVKDGYAKSQLTVAEKHLNAGGVCQGGAIFTLADVALAAVSNAGLQLTFAINSSIFSASFNSDFLINSTFGFVKGCFATKIVQQSS